MESLATTRAKLVSDEQDSKQKFSSDSVAFWNIKENTSLMVRFLPDGNPDNPYFWVEKQSIKLPFADNVTIAVPCGHQYGRQCQILQHTKSWWDDEEKKPLARTYWKKRAYLAQAFIVSGDLPEDNKPANPIRRFNLNKTLFEIVKSGLMNPDLENHPCDFDLGRDFRITKTKRGEYADYTTSSFGYKERSLSADERAAIDEYGLPDLRDFLGRTPDDEEWGIIYEMFLDSLDGKEFDVAKYGKWFKPFTKTDKAAASTGRKPLNNSPAPASQSDAIVAAIQRKTKAAA